MNFMFDTAALQVRLSFKGEVGQERRMNRSQISFTKYLGNLYYYIRETVDVIKCEPNKWY